MPSEYAKKKAAKKKEAAKIKGGKKKVDRPEEDKTPESSANGTANASREGSQAKLQSTEEGMKLI